MSYDGQLLSLGRAHVQREVERPKQASLKKLREKIALENKVSFQISDYLAHDSTIDGINDALTMGIAPDNIVLYSGLTGILRYKETNKDSLTWENIPGEDVPYSAHLTLDRKGVVKNVWADF